MSGKKKFIEQALNQLKSSLEPSEAMKRDRERRFLQKTANLLDQMERRNVFSIVLRMKGKLIELLGTSGQVLASPSLVTERGRPDLARDKGPLRIVQEFAKPPLSVQASIVKSGTEGGVFLNLSVFDKEADAFPEGIEMILASHGSKEKRRTDSSGEATFSIEKHGEYDIIMTAKGRQAAVFFITFDHAE